jgi:hypothetical protein
MVLPILAVRHCVRLQPLRPQVGAVFCEHILEHARHSSVGRGFADRIPSSRVSKLGSAEGHCEGMPLLLRLDRNLDPAGGAAVFAITGISGVGHAAIIALGGGFLGQFAEEAGDALQPAIWREDAEVYAGDRDTAVGPDD